MRSMGVGKRNGRVDGEGERKTGLGYMSEAAVTVTAAVKKG